MYPLGHIGITVFLATLLYLPVQFALIGVLLPDLVDKALFVAGVVPCGVFAAHTVFFGPIIGSIIFLVTRRKDASLGILFGSLMHLLEDAGHFVPWFYPLVNYPFNCGPLSLSFTPFTIFTEILGAALLIITVVFNSKLIYYRERACSWLKTLISWSKPTG
jgi:hypothetical protein